MAIQINDRDQLIFKLIDEHKVLLEKHISYFISDDNIKPVLIRDRLRKLFYLDYLSCKRYDFKLSWWTTPTKPIMYMLTGMSKEVIGNVEIDIEDIDDKLQKHYLELANLRMLYHIAQSNNKISDFKWQTLKNNCKFTGGFDAIVSFTLNNQSVKKAIINCNKASEISLENIKNDMSLNSIDEILIVFQSQEDLDVFQKFINTDLVLSKICNLTTHQLVYKEETSPIGSLQNIEFNAKSSMTSKFAVA